MLIDYQGVCESKSHWQPFINLIMILTPLYISSISCLDITSRIKSNCLQTKQRDNKKCHIMAVPLIKPWAISKIYCHYIMKYKIKNKIPKLGKGYGF